MSAHPLNITKVGFFHFGEHRESPLVELYAALVETQRTSDVSDSLIVLPEGFNIRQDYSCDVRVDKQDGNHWIKRDLQNVARHFRVAFVASLLLRRNSTFFNGAYLIDSKSFRRLCTKAGDDGIRRYTPHSNNKRNPLRYGSCMVGCLICMDSYTDYRDMRLAQNEQRHAALRSSLGGEIKPIICIPAHADSVTGIVQWPGTVVVFANSSHAEREPGSFVAWVNAEGQFERANECRVMGGCNCIQIVPLSVLGTAC